MATASDIFFFTKNPNLKKTLFFWEEGRGGLRGGGARVSDFFSTKNSNLKKTRKLCL